MSYFIFLIGTCIIVYIAIKLLSLLPNGGPLLNEQGSFGLSTDIDLQKIRFNDAKQLMHSGCYEEAAEQLERITSADRDNFFAFLILAECYERIGKITEAIDAYHQCIRLGANYKVYESILQLYCDLNYFSKALPFLEEVYHTQSKSDYLCLLLGLSYLNIGNLPSCERVLAVMHARGTKRANELREYMLQYQKQNFSPQTSQEDSHLKKYYDLFDLAAGASQSEIKQAYREICKVWHPDRFSHDLKLQQKAEQKMKEVNEAYKALCQA